MRGPVMRLTGWCTGSERGKAAVCRTACRHSTNPRTASRFRERSVTFSSHRSMRISLESTGSSSQGGRCLSGMELPIERRSLVREPAQTVELPPLMRFELIPRPSVAGSKSSPPREELRERHQAETD